MTALAQRADPLIEALSGLPAAALRIGAQVGEGHASDMSVVGGVRPGLLLRPGSTEELSRMLAACHALWRPVVVQGGRTGLAGGASPRPGEVALSTERMRVVGPVDALGATVVAEAGAPLARVQEAAASEGLRVGVDLGSRGSATVGGLAATNAGGLRVMAHGMMRRHVLGLEAVLADGTVLSRLGTLEKDNTGPDLSQLFIGAEGAHGVISRVALSLMPAPARVAMAFCATPGIEGALGALRELRLRMGRRLTAFEHVDGRVHRAACAHGGLSPLPSGAAAYAIIEIEGETVADEEAFEAALCELAASGHLGEIVLSRGARDRDAFWRFRDAISDSIFAMRSTYGFDIGVPLPALPGFAARTEAAIAEADPEASPWIFGHLGDGNLHYIVTTRRPEAVAEIVYGAVAEAGGALSAEHGLGREKARWLPLFRSPDEIAQMRRLKAAFDPRGILNPGRVLPQGGTP